MIIGRNSMSVLNAAQIVESSWANVWVARNLAAVDRYVVDDFLITSAGEENRSRDAFKQWVREFQTRVAGLEFEIIESFQSAEGNRVSLAVARSRSQ
jgi:hypothetical protein